MASEREIALTQIAELDANAARKPGRRPRKPRKPVADDPKNDTPAPHPATHEEDNGSGGMIVPAKHQTTSNEGIVAASDRYKKGHRRQKSAAKDPKPQKPSKVDQAEVGRLSDTISQWTVTRLVRLEQCFSM